MAASAPNPPCATAASGDATAAPDASVTFLNDERENDGSGWYFDTPASSSSRFVIEWAGVVYMAELLTAVSMSSVASEHARR